MSDSHDGWIGILFMLQIVAIVFLVIWIERLENLIGSLQEKVEGLTGAANTDTKTGGSHE